DLVETTDFGLGFIPWLASDRICPVQVRMHGSVGQIETYDPREGYELQTGLIKLIEASLLGSAARIVTHSCANRVFWSGLLGTSVAYERPPFRVEQFHVEAQAESANNRMPSEPFGLV